MTRIRSVLAAAVVLTAWCGVPAWLAAQEPERGAAVAGRVVDAETGQPVQGAAVGLEGVPGRLALTDEDGRFVLTRLPAGPHVLRVEMIGYAVARQRLVVPTAGRLTREVRLARDALQLEGLTVTADAQSRAAGELGTASVVGRDAIEHQTAASLAGVLELVPGIPVSPPGLDGLQQIALRSVPMGGAGLDPSAGDLASSGTLIILDGVPMSNNANLQSTGPRGDIRPPSSAGGGIDLRRIPATMLERVEVIRGVPSARYGDLTQGTIVVETRAGRSEPKVLGRFDANTSAGSASGGWDFATQALSANLDVTRTRLQPGLNDSDVVRWYGQLAHRIDIGGAGRLRLDTRLDVFQVFQDSPEDPEVLPGAASASRDRGFRLAERLSYSLGPRTRLLWTASVDHTRQRSFRQSRLTGPALPFTDRLVEGRQTGHYVGGQYDARVDLLGEPWLLYSRLEAELDRGWFGFDHFIRTGLELRREWNTGPGMVFDIEFPPIQSFDGVRGFDRPRRFDLVPPTFSTALYVDDQLTRPIGARGQLQVQAGLRLDALQPDGHPFSGPRDVAVQPRVNVEYAPVPRLRLRAGWGRTAKQPTLEQLFPAPQYFDIVNVNYFATDPAERLAVLTTFIRDPTNPDLGYARGTKREAGVELAMGGGGYVSVVGFSDVIDDAVGVLSSPDFILRERFDLEPAGPGQPPRLIEPAAAVDTVPVLIHRPANVLRSETEGVELTAALPEITGLNTRLEVQGVWLRSRLEKEGLDFGSSTAFTTFQLDPGIARVPFWDAPVQTGSRSLLTYRLVHQQPAAGLVVSVTVQQYLEEKRRDLFSADTLAFEGFLTRDGRVVRVPREERGNPEYADLRRGRTGLLAGTRAVLPDWMLGLQVGKTLPLEGRMTVFAFNALDRRGRFGGGQDLPRLFPSLRFGFDVSLPAGALTGWLE